MRYTVSVLAICLLAACSSGGGAVSSSGTPGLPTTPTPPSPPANQSFSSMLNNVRASNGAGPVTYDSRLGAAAQAHAADMLANNYFSHTGLNGSTFGQRIRAQGYDLRTGAENIAQGYSDEASVMQGWTNSSGHHANNINPNYQEFGLGKAGSGGAKRWVLLLATER